MTVGLETVLKRDRLVIGAALALLTALAWIYLFWTARSMTGSDMSGMDMSIPGMDMSAAAPALRTWTAAEFALMFAMWAVMMVGMMTPSAAPMILIYARVARQASQQGKPLAATGWFAGGYLLSWTVFSLGATAAQALLEQAAWLTPMMVAASRRIGGAVLILGGLYQWTALKDRCLQHCRSPFEFIQSHGGFQRMPAASVKLGFRHGIYCVGCCWALMMLLFAGGVMNLTWIATLASLVLLEKVFSWGRAIARIAGVAFILAGFWLITV